MNSNSIRSIQPNQLHDAEVHKALFRIRRQYRILTRHLHHQPHRVSSDMLLILVLAYLSKHSSLCHL